MIAINFDLFFKKEVVILVCAFNAIYGKYTVIDPAHNSLVSENVINNIIYKIAREDKFPQNVNEQYKEIEEARVPENCTNYDYDYLVNEYYSEDEVLKSDSTDEESNSAATKTSDEEAMSWNDIRDIWSLRIILKGRLWKIVKIWFAIYFVVAVPFWCTRGWCCCCLFCKFFKPTQTIDEAKRFLEANPPGVLQDKKGGVIFYEPTRKERECYEKFGHLIRTI